jgi:hypothetical protein
VGGFERLLAVRKCAETGEKSRGAPEEDILAQKGASWLSLFIFDGDICRCSRLCKGNLESCQCATAMGCFSVNISKLMAEPRRKSMLRPVREAQSRSVDFSI